jgi:hypothetical protein
VVDHRRFDAEYDGPSGEGHMTGETSERFDLGVCERTSNVESIDWQENCCGRTGKYMTLQVSVRRKGLAAVSAKAHTAIDHPPDVEEV